MITIGNGSPGGNNAEYLQHLDVYSIPQPRHVKNFHSLKNPL